MEDEQPINNKTRKTLADNNIPEAELTGSELRELNEEVNDEAS